MGFYSWRRLRGQLRIPVGWVHEHLDSALKIVERAPALKCFLVLPRRGSMVIC